MRLAPIFAGVTLTLEFQLARVHPESVGDAVGWERQVDHLESEEPINDIPPKVIEEASLPDSSLRRGKNRAEIELLRQYLPNPHWKMTKVTEIDKNDIFAELTNPDIVDFVTCESTRLDFLYANEDNPDALFDYDYRTADWFSRFFDHVFGPKRLLSRSPKVPAGYKINPHYSSTGLPSYEFFVTGNLIARALLEDIPVPYNLALSLCEKLIKTRRRYFVTGDPSIDFEDAFIMGFQQILYIRFSQVGDILTAEALRDLIKGI